MILAVQFDKINRINITKTKHDNVCCVCCKCVIGEKICKVNSVHWIIMTPKVHRKVALCIIPFLWDIELPYKLSRISSS